MKNYRIKDDEIAKIHAEYGSELIKNFRDEYNISDKKFVEMMKELEKNKYQSTYEILKNNKSLIFDKTNSNMIIVLFTEKEIFDLVEILKCNNISCKYDDFVSYNWVKFDKNTIRSLGNTMPMNEDCKIFSFNEFISEFGF